MTKRSRVGVVVLVLVMAAAGAACSDDDDGGGPGDRLTAEQFTAQATQICTGLQDDVQGTFAELSPESDPADYQGVIAELVPLVDGAIEDLDGLRPPAEVEGRFDEALAAMRAGNQAVRDAGATPEGSAAIFASEEDPYDSANAIFDELGLEECGSGGAGG